MHKIFEEALGCENVFANEAMSLHTTFRIGGNADWFLTPENAEQMKRLIQILKEFRMPYFVMGNGSNLLVGDKGIRGAVICPYKKMTSIEVNGCELNAECGALLSRVAAEAMKSKLSGMEFASGIPGSVGGAVYMNAGAYGSEMSGIIKTVKYMDSEGTIKDISSAECEFGYRKSIFTSSGDIILSCVIELERGLEEKIRTYTNELTQRRVSKQPLDKPSAGSVFKRPEGHYAGGLIEQAGLKGYSVGGAQVSEKHAGFIINKGGATARNVLDLIEHIKKTVFDMSGVMLEPEIKMVGEF